MCIRDRKALAVGTPNGSRNSTTLRFGTGDAAVDFSRRYNSTPGSPPAILTSASTIGDGCCLGAAILSPGPPQPAAPAASATANVTPPSRARNEILIGAPLARLAGRRAWTLRPWSCRPSPIRRRGAPERERTYACQCLSAVRDNAPTDGPDGPS